MKLHCPACGKFSLTDCLKVIVSRRSIHVRRRRQCKSCGARYTTVEEEKRATGIPPKEKPA